MAPNRSSVPSCHGTKGISPEAIPLRLMKRAGQAQFVPASQIGRHFPQQVGPKVAIVILKRTVRVIALSGEQCTDLVLGRREHEQIPLSIELPAGRLDDPFLNHLSRLEIHRPCRGKVAIFRKIGPFVDIESLDGFGNNKIQVGVALPMGMGAQVDRHPVGKNATSVP